MRALAPVLILAALLAGCSNREHANPFDPANPETRGRPVGFVALAGNGYVELLWQPLLGTGLDGYQLARRSSPDSTFRVIVPLLPPAADRYLDIDVQNGVTEEYQLSYVFGGSASPAGAIDLATPGKLHPWVTDLGSGQLLELTPDGRHVSDIEPGFDSPTGVAVDPAQGLVWATDSYSGQVLRLNPANGDRIWIRGLERPGAVAVDESHHTAWVCDEGLGAVYQYRPDGSPGTPAAVGPVDLPQSVAIDPTDGTIWICDNQASQVLEFAAGGIHRATIATPRPSRVAVDSLTHQAWVTSFESNVALAIAENGSVLDTVTGLAGPIGIAVDARRGRIWVAEAVSGTLTQLGRDGSVVRRTGVFRQVREVAIDLSTGNAWATAPGDGRVVVVSPAGSLLAQVAGLDQPYDVAIDPGFDLLFAPDRTASTDFDPVRAANPGAHGARWREAPPLHGRWTSRRAADVEPSSRRTQ